MKRSIFIVALCAPAAVLTVSACEKSRTDVQQKAEHAQAEGQKDMREATSEAQTKITSAEMEANRKMTDAEHGFVASREDYRHTVQSNLDDLDKRLADLDIKARHATGKEKAKLDQMLPGLHAQRAAFGRDFATIENDTAATWDASKARLDKEWKDLKNAVDRID
jgi:hypothetical protein